MRSVSAILLALAAAAAPNIVNADFTVSAATTTQSGSTYVRQWTLTASGSNSRYIDQIKIEAPGQVFISYLSGQASGVAGYVNVTGSSSAAVEAIKIGTDDDSDSDSDSDSNSGSDDSDSDEINVKFAGNATASDTLITEIFLAQESTISQLQSKSSADVIVESGVLVASGADQSLEIDVEGSGSVYVSDASAAISIKEFQAKVSGSGSLQIEAANLTFTEDAEFEVGGSGSIAVFSSALSCDELKFDVSGSGTVCVAAQSVTATKAEADGASKVSLPNSSNKYTTTGTATCTKATIPSSPGSAGSSSTDSSAGSVVGSASTPTPTNGVSALSVAVIGQLATIALAALM